MQRHTEQTRRAMRRGKADSQGKEDMQQKRGGQCETPAMRSSQKREATEQHPIEFGRGEPQLHISRLTWARASIEGAYILATFVWDAIGVVARVPGVERVRK